MEGTQSNAEAAQRYTERTQRNLSGLCESLYLPRDPLCNFIGGNNGRSDSIQPRMLERAGRGQLYTYSRPYLDLDAAKAGAWEHYIAVAPPFLRIWAVQRPTAIESE
jgi:hypothetical protein